jgi:epoxyqueuosine reductase
MMVCRISEEAFMDRIKEWLNSNGIFHYGLIRPEIIECGKEFLEPYINSKEYSEFAERDLNKRFNPEEILAGTKSILVVLFPYKMKSHIEYNDSYGVASFAEGLDYHKKNREILKELADKLGLELNESKGYGIHIDNGPMVDRYMAYSAGLGWYGKNCLLINKELGSSFTIGSLFMKKSFDSENYCNKTVIDGCGECRLCIKDCPNGAIGDGYRIDSNLCLSERMQSKREIPYDIRERIKGGAYGCDICQEACPYNSIEIKALACNYNIFEDLKLGKKSFMENYGETAFFWRGHSVYKRNLLILLGNRFKSTGDSKSFEAAFNLAASNSYMVATHAWWAMLRIDEKRAVLWINEKSKVENDDLRLAEMKRLLSHYCDEK